MQCRFRSIQKCSQLDSRHIQHDRRLIEMMAGSIFRQHVANTQIRKLQNIAHVLFELITIQTPHRPTPPRSHIAQVGLMQNRFQYFQQRFTGSHRKFVTFGRHFLSIDTIENGNPLLPNGRIIQIRRQIGKTQSAFFRLRIVTFPAVRSDDVLSSGEIVRSTLAHWHPRQESTQGACDQTHVTHSCGPRTWPTALIAVQHR